MIQANLCYSFFPSLTAAGLVRLERSAKTGIHAVLRLNDPVATQPLRERLRLSSIEQLCRQKVLVFVFHCIHALTSQLFSSFYTPIAPDLVDHERRATHGQMTQQCESLSFQGLRADRPFTLILEGGAVPVDAENSAVS